MTDLCPHVTIEADGVPEPDVGFYPTHFCADCGLIFEEDLDGELVPTEDRVELA